MTERWLPVPGFDSHYEVSDLGRVRSLKPGRGILRPTPDKRGYPRLKFHVDGRVVWRPRVHQLVALAFIGPCPDGMEVRHKDGKTDHNTPDNLQYGTSAQNRADAVLHGTHNMARKTHCKRGHEFTEANTKLTLLSSGSVSRSCRKCSALRARLHRSGLTVGAVA